MDKGFIDILKQLVKEQGNAALTDTKKCKAFSLKNANLVEKNSNGKQECQTKCGVCNAQRGFFVPYS
jgi:hypothetical protein